MPRGSIRHRAGELRHFVSILTATETRDSEGGVDRAWATSTTRYASIESLSGEERVRAGMVEATQAYRIVLRGEGLTITPENALKHGSRVFHVREVRDVDERDVKIEIIAVEAISPTAT